MGGFAIALVVLLSSFFMNNTIVPSFTPMFGILGIFAFAGPELDRKSYQYRENCCEIFSQQLDHRMGAAYWYDLKKELS